MSFADTCLIALPSNLAAATIHSSKATKRPVAREGPTPLSFVQTPRHLAFLLYHDIDLKEFRIPEAARVKGKEADL